MYLYDVHKNTFMRGTTTDTVKSVAVAAAAGVFVGFGFVLGD